MTTDLTAPSNGTTSTSDRVRWLLGGLVLSGVVLVVVLVSGGGAPAAVPDGLPDAGPITGWGLPVVRMLADLAGLTVLGLLLAAGLLVPSPATVLVRPAYAATRIAVRVALAWAGLVAVELVLTVSDILGMTPGNAFDPALIRSFATQVPQGRALLAQLVLALVVAGVARSALTSSRAAGAAVLAAITIAPPMLTGHSAASGSHDLAVASLVVHVLAASVWVGGLVALVWLAATPHPRDPVAEGWLGRALARFSALALTCWVVVAISGVVNAGVRLGSFSALGSAYGLLVVSKTLALVVLGGFGWWHRGHTVGQVGSNPGAARGLFVRVAAVELLLMGTTVGLAVGLSRTPTPSAGELDTSPATELLGFSLPPAPTLARMLSSGVADGFAIAFLAFTATAYAAGVIALRRRGDRWPVGRTIAWYAGLALIAWATVGGLGLYSHVMFSAHMVAHMVLSMIAPLGLVLGAPVTLALRTLPGRRIPREQGPRQVLNTVLHSRVIRVLSHPIVAAVLFVGSLYALYFSPLFTTLMDTHLGHVAMETHFVLVGCLFFWVLVGIDPSPRVLHPLARVGLLLVVMPFHAFFAIALMNTQDVLAPAYYGTLDRPYATDLLADQHYGGALSWALGEVPIVLVVAAIFVQWFRSDRRESRRSDRQHDRQVASGTDELSSYNAFLARLAQETGPRNTSTTTTTPSSTGGTDEQQGRQQGAREGEGR
jgi:cytochrome c oxidase assembly factor CtaG/putative copper export protein